MEPLHLTLHNFGSYRELSLDMSSLSLAAIVGPNGSGKSTLVDAMLWALYGQAGRGGHGSLDYYVTRGQGDGSVRFEFLLAGHSWQVFRRRDVRRQKSTLEFWRDSPQGPMPAGGRTLDETQAEIIRLLRMSYEAFTASCVMLQGQGGTFTGQMSDAERRQVLGGILGLDSYGGLLAAARQRHVEAITARDKALEDHRRLSLLAQGLGAAQLGLASAEAAVPRFQAELREKRTALDNARAAQAAVQALRVKVEAAAGTVASLRREQAALVGREAELQGQIDEGKADLVRPERIAAELDRARVDETAAAEALAVITAKLKRAEAAVAAAGPLRDQAQAADDEIKRLETVLAQLEARRRELVQANTSTEAVLEDAAAIRTAQGALPEAEARHNAWVERGEQARLAALRVDGVQRKSDAWEADRKARASLAAARLDAAQRQAALTGEVPCQGTALQPACKLLADAVAASEMLVPLEADCAAIAREENPHRAELAAAALSEKQVGHDPGAAASATEALRLCRQAANRYPELVQAEAQARVTAAALQTLNDNIVAAQASVTAATETLHRSLALLDESSPPWWAGGSPEAGLAADQDRHAGAARAHLLAAQRVAAAERSLAEALAKADAVSAALPARLDALGAVRRQISQMEEDIAGQLLSHLRAEEKMRVSEGHLAPSEGLEAEIGQLESALANLQQNVGRAQADVAAAVQAAEAVPAAEAAVIAARQRAEVGSILVEAFNPRGGIQALIVENAVPQVERLANAMLGSMAGGRLAVRLITQRETKAGAVAETLRIVVVDEGTEREYATYSGGERLLVDVALRVALSRFLCHRAGAEIQMLVLDEGFGALDGANTQAVLLALQTLSQQFRRVLVCSHVPEVQELLPQRIEVRRTAQGSEATVVA